jgi:histidine triad (HIT) family protein
MPTIFGKIIKKELPAEVVFENDHILAFYDIHPVAPVHILILPKKEIQNLQSAQKEDLPLLAEILEVVQQLARQYKIEDGYRLVVNNGANAGQTIDHLHFHLIGGRPLRELV